MKLIVKQFVNKFSDERFYSLILLITVAAAYAFQLTKMGFYWDDWQVVFLSHPGTPADFWNYFIFDRPFSAWTYILTLPVLGISPLAWQLFSIIMRWLGALGFCWVLRGIWPDRTWQIHWMGILFAVYPGFLQQPISAAFSQHFITYALFTTSLGLTIAAIREPKRYFLFSIIACFFSLLQLLTMEYFLGLELLRPVFIFVLFLQIHSEEKLLKKVLLALKAWLPYLLVIVVFCLWRFGYYPSISQENTPTLIQDFRTNPLTALVQMIQYALQDFLHIGFTAWVNALQPAMIIQKSLGLLLFSLIIALFIAGWFYFNPKQPDKTASNEKSFSIQAIIIGFLGIILGGLPVWSTNRQVIVGLWSDRFTLAPMFGAVILLVAVLDWLIQSRNKKTIVLGAILFFAMAAQVQNIDRYRANWELQRSYYWQLFWRAPALKSGTAILAPKLPMSYVSDYAVGYALNVMYDPNRNSTDVNYWFLIAPRAVGDKFTDYKPALPIKYSLRNIEFNGSTSNSLGVSFSAARSCLRVLDPIYQEAPPLLEDNLGGIERDMYPVSNISQIELGSATHLPADVFGAEPEHTWCYYYQKADLARQMKDWKLIGELGASAEEAGLRTKEGVEQIPFIEGYAHLGIWEKAFDSTYTAKRYTAMMQPVLCSTWQRIIADTPPSDARAKVIFDVQDDLACPVPLH